MGQGGRLFLGMNDSRLDDNSGWLEVRIQNRILMPDAGWRPFWSAAAREGECVKEGFQGTTPNECWMR